MTEAEVLALVDRHPQGISTKEATALTGAKGVGSRLSRLFAYGKLERRRSNRMRTNEVLWLPKPKATP